MTYTAQTRVFKVDPSQPDPQAIRAAAAVLRSGGLVAFPTETVYGLGANALDSEAVSRIFSAKGRPVSDPIIVHLHSREQLGAVAVDVPELALELAQRFWAGPLTMVLKRHANIPPNVSAGRDTVAVRMPSHPVALALLRAVDVPVAAPSANLFARPSATTAQHVLDDLSGRVDVVLDGGATLIGVESTVLDLTKETPVVLRPGGVTLEALRTILPDVQLVSKYLRAEDEGAEAPGMLVKHYSPRAEVRLFVGELPAVIAAMRATAQELVAVGERVGILARDDECGAFEALPVTVIPLGTNFAEIARRLFTAMRALDEQGVDMILVRGIEQTGLGAAIWDRLLRAAEGRVIQC
jgi:L-threonylcarbamoyladenylate synthase